MSPWLLFSAFVASSVFPANSNREQLLERYIQLRNSAIEAGQLDAAEVYFARAMALSGQSKELAFKFANQTLSESQQSHGKDSESAKRRAVQLLTSLAPNDKPGYRPAHRVLATYWSKQQPQTAIAHLISLRHRMYANPGDIQSVIELAKFMGEHGYHRQAIDLLSPHNQPRALMARAKWHSAMNDRTSAEKCLSDATELLNITLKKASSAE